MVSRKLRVLRHGLALVCLLTLMGAQVPAFARLTPQGDSRQNLENARVALQAAMDRESARPTKKNGQALDQALAEFNAAAATRRADIIARLAALGEEIKQAQAQGLDAAEFEKE